MQEVMSEVMLEALVYSANVMVNRQDCWYLVYYICTNQKLSSVNNVPIHSLQYLNNDHNYHMGVVMIDLEPCGCDLPPRVLYFEPHKYNQGMRLFTINGR